MPRVPDGAFSISAMWSCHTTSASRGSDSTLEICMLLDCRLMRPNKWIDLLASPYCWPWYPARSSRSETTSAGPSCSPFSLAWPNNLCEARTLTVVYGTNGAKPLWAGAPCPWQLNLYGSLVLTYPEAQGRKCWTTVLVPHKCNYINTTCSIAPEDERKKLDLNFG